MNETLRPYYFLSRKAFIDHQYRLGPNVLNAQTLRSNQSLEQMTEVNGINFFLFDLRSNRNNCQKQTVEEAQMKTFKDWCAGLEEGEEAIIVSSIPFFYTTSEVISALAEGMYEGPLRDDILDGWSSAANIGQRDTIISELIKLRARNIKPIILSSDVHIGGLITAWYENPASGKNEKLCYEIISSGLSHESLGEARSGIVATLRKRSRKVEKDESAFTVNGKAIYPVFNFTRSRLNFAALEFTKNKNTVASLFIIGDKDGTVAEREMPLDWDESFRSFYKSGYKPFHWFLLPWKLFDRKMPEVEFNLMEIGRGVKY